MAETNAYDSFRFPGDIHPPISILKEFIRQTLPSEQMDDAVETHIEQCEGCGHLTAHLTWVEPLIRKSG